MADDTPAADFTKAAQPPGSREFNFEAAVAEFYDTYPERTNSVYFVDVSTGNIAHPDQAVVQDLIELMNSEQGKKSLQPISLAGAIASHYTPNTGEAQHLFESFEKLHGQTPLGELTNIVLTTPFPDTFKWTSTVLKPILEKKIATPKGLEAEFNEEATKTLPPKIAERAAKLADYDFIGEVLRDKPMPKGTAPFLNGHPKA